MTEPPRGHAPLWPVGVLIVAMALFQSGGSLGKGLFPLVGAPGATTLRLSLSALILLAMSRPWRGGPLDRAGLAPVLLFGLAMAGLNGFFFLAIRTIPLGIAVAIDFLGPLGVAIAYSRRPVDGLWVVLAIVGIAAMALPVGFGAVRLDPLGLAYDFAAAASWAIYILAGRVAGARLSDQRATAFGLAVAALVTLPFGIATAGVDLVSPAVLPLALLVAVLSSALPYRLEMMALTRLPPRVFGVMMSLEPALAALSGWVILGERLTARQEGAIALVIVASAGAALTAARPAPARDG